MIVMKFGGTSVESAEAIERVAGIVRERLAPAARGGGFGDGQDHQQAAGDRRRGRGGRARRGARSICEDLREFHLRESAGLRRRRRSRTLTSSNWRSW